MSNAVNDAHATLLEEIEGLLAATDDRDAPLARIEDVLTAGYAHALALEAERWRLERRIRELAAGMGDSRENGQAEELAGLARRISTAAGELTQLRGLLVSLRARASALRAA